MPKPKQSPDNLIIIGGALPAAVLGSLLLLPGLFFWIIPDPSYSGGGWRIDGQTLAQISIEIGKWMSMVGALLLGLLALSRAPVRFLALFGISLNFSATLSGLVLILLIVAKAEVHPLLLLFVLGGLLFLSACFLNTGLSSLIWLWKKVAESKKDWWLIPLFNRPPPGSLIMFAGSVIGLSFLSVTFAVIMFASLEIGLRLLDRSFVSFLLAILFSILGYF